MKSKMIADDGYRRRCGYRGLYLPLICFFLAVCGVYGDQTPEMLSLDEAVQKALSYSGERKIQLLEQSRKEYAAKEAKSKMFPVIDLQAGATYMFNPPEGVVLPKGAMGYEPNQYSQAPVPFPEEDYRMMEDPENTYFKIEAALQQPVYTWGKLKTGLALANQDVQLTLLETEKTEIYIRHQIRQMYYGIVFCREALKILHDMEKLLEQMLKDREKEYTESLISLQPVLEAQKDIFVLQTKMAEINEAYVEAAEGLFFISGIDAECYSFSDSLPSDVHSIDKTAPVIEYALQHASEIKVLSAKEALADLYAALEKKSGQLRPDFFLNIGMDVTGEQVPVLQSNWMDTWNVNLTVTLGTKITLWDSGQSASKRKQAQISGLIAAEGLRQTISKTEMTVRNLLEAHQVAYRRVKEFEAKRRLFEEQFKNAIVSFENELITRGDRLGAEAAYLQNEVGYLSALLSYQNIESELKALIGLKDPAISLYNFQ